MIRDEVAFAALIKPTLLSSVKGVAKAMCNTAAMEDEAAGCTCETDGGSCVAFGLYGDLAHTAVLAMAPAASRESVRGVMCAALDAAHNALRSVDASDTTAPQTEQTLDRVSAAIRAVEKAAQIAGYRLSEFR